MKVATPRQAAIHIRQLGLHHFAYLRGVADGVDMQECAKRYLGIDHGHAAITMHRQVVDKLRGVARRRGEKSWRLIGIVIRPRESVRPTLDEWTLEKGLEGWTESDLLEMYEEAFPQDRKADRNNRLRVRQKELLKSLQDFAAQAPKPTDPIAGWFDESTSERLRRSSLLMIGELQERIAMGGRWWSAIQAIGELKARRIENYLIVMCGKPVTSIATARMADAVREMTKAQSDPLLAREVHLEQLPQPSPSPSPARLCLTPIAMHAMDGSTGPNRALATVAATSAGNDREAIEKWIAARAQSIDTAKSYRREAERLLLWCVSERRKPLSSMILDDCLAYMTFLEHIPPGWISRRRAERMKDGWAPFSGQLSLDSRRQAVQIVSGLFSWLVKANYLIANPWVLVNRKTGDDASKGLLDSRAFTPEAWTVVRSFAQLAPPSPSKNRTIFILDFGEATGLRASELVGAVMGDFKPHKGRWALQVHGKGSKNRVVAIAKQAMGAMLSYMESRGLPPLGDCPADIPLIASAIDPLLGVSYRPLYESTKAWFTRAIQASDLTGAARSTAYKASLHWLRHTCGTRALERGAPLAMVQEQLGHADPRMTMRYSKTQLDQLLDGMDAVFG